MTSVLTCFYCVFTMEKRTIIIGILLILLGFAFFAGTGFSKYTALIPVPPGLILVLLGCLAMSESRRKLVMHIASLLALIGALPLFMGLPKVIKMLQGIEVQRPLAAAEMSAMGLLCAVYFVLCLKYFINRRKAEG